MLLEELNNEILPRFNFGLSTLGSVSWQSVGGAIGTGTHGTGAEFGSLSSYAVSMKFMDSSGKNDQIACIVQMYIWWA